MAQTLQIADTTFDIVPPAECFVAQDWVGSRRVRVINHKHLFSAEERPEVCVKEVLLFRSSRVWCNP